MSTSIRSPGLVRRQPGHEQLLQVAPELRRRRRRTAPPTWSTSCPGCCTRYGTTDEHPREALLDLGARAWRPLTGTASRRATTSSRSDAGSRPPPRGRTEHQRRERVRVGRGNCEHDPAVVASARRSPRPATGPPRTTRRSGEKATRRDRSGRPRPTAPRRCDRPHGTLPGGSIPAPGVGRARSTTRESRNARTVVALPVMADEVPVPGAEDHAERVDRRARTTRPGTSGSRTAPFGAPRRRLGRQQTRSLRSRRSPSASGPPPRPASTPPSAP